MRSDFVRVPVRRMNLQGQRILELLAGPRPWTPGRPVDEPLAHLCGGFARWCASPQVQQAGVSDMDLFCSSEGSYGPLLEVLGGVGLKPESESQVAVKMATTEDFPLPVQVIKPFQTGARRTYGSLAEVLDDFDFTVARVGLAADDGIYALADAAFEHDEAEGLLRWSFIDCPVGAVMRALKYARKGYRVRAGELLRVFREWELRGAEYRERLGFLLDNVGDLEAEQINELELMLRVD